ncbi:unnamed protein product [Hymenolepis diminuta]|uniref:Uncharacterized protein n=1 Tax=Hymenolepis diminuta TaxID=6216 RepID=A0A564YH02_HYMDI|nr:unnamed protein product [Hymenolepis diminuta]
MFHHNPLISETFSTSYALYRDTYENSMANLSHATRITILLRKAHRSNHHLYSFYLQPMDPADQTYEKMISKLNSIVGGNISPFNLTIREDENVLHHVENKFRYLIFILGLRSPCRAEIRLCPS